MTMQSFVPSPSGDEAVNHSRNIRVMVVDDSVVIRGLVSRWLNEEDGIEVAAKHANGLLAVNNIEACDPDVVVLDIEMPEMDGMEALGKMMALKPELIVIMASTLTARNARISLDAMSLGATDYIPKPESNSGITTSLDFRREIVEKVRALGKRALSPARMRTHVGGSPASTTQRAALPSDVTPDKALATKISLRPFSSVMPRLLAIGSSTGGPQALVSLFETLAGKIDNVPCVITQHMPPTFTALLAEHLGRVTQRQAKEAVHGEEIKAGHIYVAPGAKHFMLVSENGKVFARLEDGPQINFCKPAVDPLFQSAVRIYGNAILGVILTGMGHDGRDGAHAIADAGGSVIAQDEATSVVWGMPGAAAEAGVCSAVLPLDQVGPKILQTLGRKL